MVNRFISKTIKLVKPIFLLTKTIKYTANNKKEQQYLLQENLIEPLNEIRFRPSATNPVDIEKTNPEGPLIIKRQNTSSTSRNENCRNKKTSLNRPSACVNIRQSVYRSWSTEILFRYESSRKSPKFFTRFHKV